MRGSIRAICTDIQISTLLYDQCSITAIYGYKISLLPTQVRLCGLWVNFAASSLTFICEL